MRRWAGINFVASLVIEDPKRPRAGLAAAPAGRPGASPADRRRRSTNAIAFLDNCYGIKPGEAAFRRALAYNMLVPDSVRQAIRGLVDRPRRDRRKTPPRARADLGHARPQGHDRAAGGRGNDCCHHPGCAPSSWFDACGHSPFCEDAPRFNAELAAFMSMTRG